MTVNNPSVCLKSTRGQKDLHTAKAEDNVVGHVNVNHQSISLLFMVNFQEGNEHLFAKERAVDGSDESIVSTQVVENDVLNNMGKMTKISPVTPQVSLNADSDDEKFIVFRTWTPSWTTIWLSSGYLAFVSVKYLVAEADLVAEDLHIGLPVPRYLGVDTMTLLEERRDLLDDTDCSTGKPAQNCDKSKRVSRLMVARTKRVSNDAVIVDNEFEATSDISILSTHWKP